MSKPAKKLSDFKPISQNPNKHTARGMGMLEKSIGKYGYLTPMTAAADGTILDGNARLEQVGTQMPADPIIIHHDGKRPIIAIRDDIKKGDSKMAKEIAVVANRVGQVDLEWDAEVFKDLKNSDLDLGDFFMPEELAKICGGEVTAGKTDPDEAPEPPKKPKTRPGDLYSLGEHRLLCGDSTKLDDVKLLMGGGVAEMLFTSPPYSDMREYRGCKDLSIENIIKFIPAFVEFAKYQVINLGIQRKDHEIIQYWDAYIAEAKRCGYKFLSWNVWCKQNAGSVGNQSAFVPIIHEWIFIFGEKFKNINRTLKRKTEIKPRKNPTRRQPDGALKRSSIGVQETFKEMESVFFCNFELTDIRSKHPAVFPVQFPLEYIKAMTTEGDIVAEPFCGSGSVLIACEQTGRKCRGIEIDPAYCDVIVERWEKFTGKKAKLCRNDN